MKRDFPTFFSSLTSFLRFLLSFSNFSFHTRLMLLCCRIINFLHFFFVFTPSCRDEKGRQRLWISSTYIKRLQIHQESESVEKQTSEKKIVSPVLTVDMSLWASLASTLSFSLPFLSSPTPPSISYYWWVRMRYNQLSWFLAPNNFHFTSVCSDLWH